MAVAVAATVAVAQTSTPPAPNTEGNAPIDTHALDYWNHHAREGFMTREQALRYRNRDGSPYMDRMGRPMDATAIDRDGDGRVSQPEWLTYHQGRNYGDATAGGINDNDRR